MKHRLPSGPKRISRRTMLASAAALAATPALAEECRLGPPPHEKGALVWMDMDQIELDAAYSQEAYAPLQAQISRRRANNSELVRARFGAPLRAAYGPTEFEKLDVYRTKRAKAPIFVFMHGGGWVNGEGKNFADCAELFINAGAHYITLDFAPVDKFGGDLRVLADQVRRAIAWVYKNAASFDGDPDRLYVGGHSTGAHLCSVALVTDWQKDFGLPPDFIKGAMCMSGMYDLKPVRLAHPIPDQRRVGEPGYVPPQGSPVKFDDQMEAAMSSPRHIDLLRTPLVLSYGTYETPEIQRQNRDFAAAIQAAGKPVELIKGTNYSHLEMLESLGHPYGPNGRAMLALMKLSLT